MKKINALLDRFMLLLVATCLAGFAYVGLAVADTGHEGATRIEIGRSTDFRKVTGSSVTGTAIFSSAVNRPDGFCLNNTGTTVWIGSVTATQNGTMHSNIANGMPIFSSGTYRLGGSMTGDAYLTCNAGVSTCEMRCNDGKVP